MCTWVWVPTNASGSWHCWLWGLRTKLGCSRRIASDYSSPCKDLCRKIIPRREQLEQSNFEVLSWGSSMLVSFFFNPPTPIIFLPLDLCVCCSLCVPHSHPSPYPISRVLLTYMSIQSPAHLCEHPETQFYPWTCLISKFHNGVLAFLCMPYTVRILRKWLMHSVCPSLQLKSKPQEGRTRFLCFPCLLSEHSALSAE